VADRSIKNLREELENLHAELEGSVAARGKEASSMHSSVSAMTEQIGNLEVEKEELEDAVARLLDEVKVTKARATEAEAQLNVLEREREELVSAREGLGQDKSTLHEKVLELTEVSSAARHWLFGCCLFACLLVCLFACLLGAVSSNNLNLS
jgi:predicted nuclease with TOPRIM domain